MPPNTLIPATRGQLRAEGDKISELSPSHAGFTVTMGLEQDPFCVQIQPGSIGSSQGWGRVARGFAEPGGGAGLEEAGPQIGSGSPCRSLEKCS